MRLDRRVGRGLSSALSSTDKSVARLVNDGDEMRGEAVSGLAVLGPALEGKWYADMSGELSASRTGSKAGITGARGGEKGKSE